MSLTSAQTAAIDERNERQLEEQGRTPEITDPSVLAKVARIVAGDKNADPSCAGSASRDACGGTVTATPKDAA